MWEYKAYMKMNCEKLVYLLAFNLAWVCSALAEGESGQEQKIQTIKRQVLELSRDLNVLEKELLFPLESRLTVYLSLETGGFLAMDTVTLTIDGNQETQHQYSHSQLDALRRGGAHRLYLGNVEPGEHQIAASFTGKDPEGRNYRRMTQFVLEKAGDAKSLELKIIDSTALQQPKFSVKEW